MGGPGASVDETELNRLFDGVEKTIRAGAELRLRLARDLHDDVAQNLAEVLVSMELMKSEQEGRMQVQQQLTDFQRSVRQSLSSIRELLFELRELPEVESEFAVDLRARVRAFQRESGVRTWLYVSRQWPHTLSTPTAEHLRRIVLEALRNVRRHSGATRARVMLRSLPEGRLQVSVADNGRGMTADDKDATATLGIRGMRERAAILGGALRLSKNRNGGTTVSVTVEREAATARGIGLVAS